MLTGVDYKNIRTDKTQGVTELISDEKLIVQEIKTLMNFPKHSLFFGNSIGVDLERYLYLSNKTATFNLIKNEITEVFNKYPRASLISLQLSITGDSKLLIDLEVSINGTLTTVSLEMLTSQEINNDYVYFNEFLGQLNSLISLEENFSLGLEELLDNHPEINYYFK